MKPITEVGKIIMFSLYYGRKKNKQETYPELTKYTTDSGEGIVEIILSARMTRLS